MNYIYLLLEIVDGDPRITKCDSLMDARKKMSMALLEKITCDPADPALIGVEFGIHEWNAYASFGVTKDGSYYDWTIFEIAI